MRKLLVVEDERWEREGLVALIDKARFGIGQVLTASDGLQGLTLIKSQRPEIIITDIRMPGLSGLDMLKQAGEALQGSVCIILSGYNEFAYARAALRMGAADFLVKPLTERDLVDALERAQRALEALPDRPAPQGLDLAGLLEGKGDGREAARGLGLPSLRGLRVLALSGTRGDAALPPVQARREGYTLCLLRPADPLPNGGYAALGMAQVVQDVGAAAAQAVKAMERALFHGLASPVAYSDCARETRGGELKLRADKLRLEQAMAALDEERVRAALDALRLRLKGDVRLGPSEAQRLLSQVCGIALPGGSRAPAATLDGLLDGARAACLTRVQARQLALSEPARYVIRRVALLVDRRYSDVDLNLQSLAGQIYLSPNYVGSLFKKSTGVSFSDYLGRHRLLAAGELLAQEGMRVAAAANAVGIANVSYFCVQFRSVYGVTPSQFKAEWDAH